MVRPHFVDVVISLCAVSTREYYKFQETSAVSDKASPEMSACMLASDSREENSRPHIQSSLG
jgi:hypothetical protein